MFCPNCGKVASGRFCELCGSPLDQDQNLQTTTFQSGTTTQPPAQPQPQTYVQPQPQQATTQQPQYPPQRAQYNQQSQYPSNSSNIPSRFTILISGLMPIVGWIMGIIEVISGNGKKGGFYFANATVCFFLGMLGVFASYMFGMLGSIIGLAMAISYVSSRAKKVEQGEIQLN